VEGFCTLHIGLVVALIALAGAWVAAIGQDGWFWHIVSPRTIYYRTILHFTVSFVLR
jgi:hypothetical protein